MGPGWHQPRIGNKYNGPILRAQLDIQTPSGLTLIGTDSNWRVKESCISPEGHSVTHILLNPQIAIAVENG